MKLYEHPETEKTLDRLPELPPGVEVPDDISGIGPPTTQKPTTGGVRWMRWLAAILLLGAAGVLTALLLQGVQGNEADETPVDYMETYGTDNAVINPNAAEPGTIEIVAAEDYMALYGTDNAVIVPATDVADYREHLRALYGADTVVLVPVTGVDDFMALYGTDNPVFAPEPTLMDLYGTDNPVFVPETTTAADNAEHYMALFGN